MRKCFLLFLLLLIFPHLSHSVLVSSFEGNITWTQNARQFNNDIGLIASELSRISDRFSENPDLEEKYENLAGELRVLKGTFAEYQHRNSVPSREEIAFLAKQIASLQGAANILADNLKHSDQSDGNLFIPIIAAIIGAIATIVAAYIMRSPNT